MPRLPFVTKVNDALKGQLLTLSHREPDKEKPAKTKVYGGAFKGERGDLISLFGVYFSRHQQAELRSGC